MTPPVSPLPSAPNTRSWLGIQPEFPQEAGNALLDRIVVLWDFEGPDALPCGFVIGYERAVRVRIVDDGWGLREWWTEPLEGDLEPDLTRAMYEPGTQEHFDSVCASLFKTFAVTKLPRPRRV